MGQGAKVTAQLERLIFRTTPLLTAGRLQIQPYGSHAHHGTAPLAVIDWTRSAADGLIA